MDGQQNTNPLNAELNPICQLLALLGAHHILHVSRIRVSCSYKKCRTNIAGLPSRINCYRIRMLSGVTQNSMFTELFVSGNVILMTVM